MANRSRPPPSFIKTTIRTLILEALTLGFE
jgi:hypothetical protein